MFNWKRFLIGLLIIFIDLAIYVFLGLILLDYEDHFNDYENKNEYWSLSSMTLGQKAAYIGWHIWIGINILAILYILFRFTKHIKRSIL